jgi:hypothetical protein
MTSSKKACLLAAFMLCPLAVSGQMSICGRGAVGNLGVHPLTSPSAEVLAAAGAPAGIYIDWLVKGGPAEQAGLQPHDVIVQIGGVDVRSPWQLNQALGSGRLLPGQAIEVAYVRKGQVRKTTVTIADPTLLFPRMRTSFVGKWVEEASRNQNGVTINDRKEIVFYRDSLGRQAEEQQVPMPGGGMLKNAHIFDPIRRVNIHIDHSARKALVLHSRLPAALEQTERREAIHWGDQPSEYLGTRSIQGISCEGYRSRRVLLNAADFGVSSTQPLVYSYERWYSDLAAIPLLEIDEDRLSGRTESQLVDLKEGVEPDGEVFEVPEGYTVEERTLDEERQKAPLVRRID